VQRDRTGARDARLELQVSDFILFHFIYYTLIYLIYFYSYTSGLKTRRVLSPRPERRFTVVRVLGFDNPDLPRHHTTTTRLPPYPHDDKWGPRQISGPLDMSKRTRQLVPQQHSTTTNVSGSRRASGGTRELETRLRTRLDLLVSFFSFFFLLLMSILGTEYPTLTCHRVATPPTFTH
jgi:hypothetical protein